MRRSQRDRLAIAIGALGLLPELPLIMQAATSVPPRLVIIFWGSIKQDTGQ